MDINQALSTVEALRRQIDGLGKALAASEKTEYGKPVKVETSVRIYCHGSETVHLDREAAVELLRVTKALAEERLAKLQPVIDMANAALKGIGA